MYRRYLTNIGRGRRAEVETRNFRFKELLPLQLKNSVSGKSERGVDNTCIQDMAVMFACMKSNDFNETLCSKEIKTFQECYLNQMKVKNERRELEETGKDSPGTKNLTPKQLNRLLKNHPQFNEPSTIKYSR